MPPPPRSLTVPDTLELQAVEDPRALLAGNAVRLLRNGTEVFPAWLAAIAAAQVRISLEMYIFSDDAIGRRFAEALADAARRGVAVRLLYDYAGCRETPAAFFRELRDRGVHVIAYHKYRVWRPRLWTLIRRNHRKTLICDGEVAFAGGLNISNEWVPAAEGGGDWHDAVLEVQGPAVAAMERSSSAPGTGGPASGRLRLEELGQTVPRPAMSAWRSFGTASCVSGSPSAAPPFTPFGRAREALPRQSLLSSRTGGVCRPWSRRRCASRRAAAASPGQRLADSGFGCPGRVRTPARRGRAHLAQSGRHPHQGAGRRRRFRLHRSYNFDHRSLAYNLEMVINVVDRRTAEDVTAMLAGDMAEAEELTRERFERRSPFDRLLERLAYSLRKWL